MRLEHAVVVARFADCNAACLFARVGVSAPLAVAGAVQDLLLAGVVMLG